MYLQPLIQLAYYQNFRMKIANQIRVSGRDRSLWKNRFWWKTHYQNSVNITKEWPNELTLKVMSLAVGLSKLQHKQWFGYG